MTTTVLSIAEILREPYYPPILVLIDLWLEAYCASLRWESWTYCIPALFMPQISSP